MAFQIISGIRIMDYDKDLVAVRVKQLSKKSVSELVALKENWISEYRKSNKVDELTMRRQSDAENWLVAIEELITSSNNASVTNNDTENMGISEAAAYLSVSESKLYKMTSKSEISHSKVGKRIRFKKNDLDQFLEDKKKHGSESFNSDNADSHIANYPLKKKKRRNTH